MKKTDPPAVFEYNSCKSGAFWPNSFKNAHCTARKRGRLRHDAQSPAGMLFGFLPYDADHISGAMTFRTAPASRVISFCRFTSCMVIR